MARKQNEPLDYVLRRVEPGGQQAERRPFEQLWFGNLAYYSGNQHFIAEDGTIRIPRRLNPRKSFYKANFIAPNVLRAVSRLMAANLEFHVAPESPDVRDRHAARVSEKLFSHLRETTHFKRKQTLALIWAAICGSGFLKITWDPLRGEAARVYIHPRDGVRADLNDFQEREYEKEGWFEDNHLGDVRTDVVNPFQIHWDWAAREGGWEDASWAAQVHSKRIEDLVDEYGTDLRNRVSPEETDAGAVRYQEAIATMTAGMYGLNLGQYPHQLWNERTRVIELFDRPAKKNNWEGRYILVAGGHVVRDEPNPYASTGNPIPFVKIDWWPMPGRFIGISLVEQIRAPQKAYNTSRSHQHDVERTNGYPITILPSNAGIRHSKLVSLPGVILEGNLNTSPPIFSNPPNLPPYIGQNSDRALFELNSISAMSSPSKEAYPSGVRSSLAIQAIQEDNNAILSPTAESIAEATREAGRMMLTLAGQLYDQPRVVRTLGKGGEYEVEYFFGAEMRNNHDLRFYGDPSRLETAAAYQERIAMLVEIGVLDPQREEDRVAILKAVDAKTADEIVTDNLQDETQEEKWLERMIGQPGFAPPMLGVENPHVRSKVLERFIKRDEFWEIEEASRQAILQRHQQFSGMIQEQLQRQIELQGELAGSQQRQAGTPSRPRRAQTA